MRTLDKSLAAEQRQIPSHGRLTDPESLAELPYGRTIMLFYEPDHSLPPFNIEHVSTSQSNQHARTGQNAENTAFHRGAAPGILLPDHILP